MGEILYNAFVAGVAAVILAGGELLYEFIKKKITSKNVLGKPKEEKQKKTRLWLHMFFHYFFLPFRFVISVKALLNYAASLKDDSFVEIVIGFAVILIALLLLVVAFIGLFRRMRYAIYALFGYFLVDVLCGVYSLILCLLYYPEDSASSIGSLLGVLVVSLIVCVYYWKRRNFFVNKLYFFDRSMNQSVRRSNYNTQTTDHGSPQYYSPHTAINVNAGIVNDNQIACYCHRCGTKLTKESVFCHKCGTKAIRE